MIDFQRKKIKIRRNDVKMLVEFRFIFDKFLFKTQITIYNELNLVSQRFYLAFLINAMTNKFIQYVFSKMKRIYFIYQNVKKK